MLYTKLKNRINNPIDLLGHMPASLKKGVRSFCFNRWGGVSKRPFHELNVSGLTEDDKANVKKNINIIKMEIGVQHMVWTRQVHGTDFIHIDHAISALAVNSTTVADGLFTTASDVGLMIKTADCQPVVMFDPVKRVIANIHCGWRGSVKGILPRAVLELGSVYGSCPEDIWAGIGPSLGPCCAEFKGWRKILPEWMADFQCKTDYFDFWQISKRQLVDSGIPEKQIYCAGICTVCNKDYFSYRREKDTGRFATVVAISI